MVCMLNDLLSAGATDLTFTRVLYDSCSASPRFLCCCIRFEHEMFI